ncbi:MANNAN ENDO-14-BETA-MANNOSIDASE-LIKE PROTEIN [Salix purpurea]|uniref:mannan endo-1,4-beta-mannosidase n=1 Tax=Salix purpurea TaxID=77065 RepID=A0A9Q0ZMP0_SALPP|nr:MANNAN ENDO-14-BETA-MANNOSIDASE-LIKE PROTEIN [Salix purpurea]
MRHLAVVLLLTISIHQGFFHLHVEAGDGFIRTRGVHFLLNGSPYYANGFNAYWLMYAASDPPQRSKVSAAFREAASHGLTVARTWAFSDGGYRPLQHSPGSYNEQMFKGLDFVVAEARRYGIKLILSLANNYDNFGGKKQYVNWARNRGQYLTSDDDFFRHPVVKGYYKNHIKARVFSSPWHTGMDFFKLKESETTVLYRYNSFTRIHYKDDPTIMAWELMNEPRCSSDTSGRTIQKLDGSLTCPTNTSEVQFIAFQSELNFLVPPLLVTAWITEMASFEQTSSQITASPELILQRSMHIPDQWLSSSSDESQLSFLNKWLDTHIQDAQNILRKPILIAEFGKILERPWFQHIPEGPGVQYRMDNFRDGYDIVLGQPSSTANIIAQQAHKLHQIRKIFQRTRNVERWKRARAARARRSRWQGRNKGKRIGN